MYGTGQGWDMGFGMWLIPILLVIIVIYFLKDTNKDKTFSAQDILDKRYANGEINLEEYSEQVHLRVCCEAVFQGWSI